LLDLIDNAYNQTYDDFGTVVYHLDLSQSGRWYDFTIKQNPSSDFERRYMGRVENGEESISDPAMSYQ